MVERSCCLHVIETETEMETKANEWTSGDGNVGKGKELHRESWPLMAGLHMVGILPILIQMRIQIRIPGVEEIIEDAKRVIRDTGTMQHPPIVGDEFKHWNSMPMIEDCKTT